MMGIHTQTNMRCEVEVVEHGVSYLGPVHLQTRVEGPQGGNGLFHAQN
jgi:hypothetical protein